MSQGWTTRCGVCVKVGKGCVCGGGGGGGRV